MGQIKKEIENYQAAYDPETNLLSVGFIGEMVDGDVILQQVAYLINELADDMAQNGSGKVLRVTGRMSVLIAGYIAARLGAFFPAVAYFDPALNKFVVITSKVGQYKIGDKCGPGN